MRLLSHKKWPATFESFYESMDFVVSCAKAQGFSEERVGEIELALEEILVNIIKYAYQGKDEGDMEISCSEDEGKLVVEIADAGVPFNILEAADPDITAEVEVRSVGGLGIYFVKQLMDDIRYRREGDRNRLTLVAGKSRKTTTTA
jgi:serine/threonine-protein kinase RsbW